MFDYDINRGLLSKVTTSKNISIEFTYYDDSDKKSDNDSIDVLTIKEVNLPDGSKIGYTYNKSSNKAKNNKTDKQNNGEG